VVLHPTDAALVKCGTCSMKPREKGGVLDSRLNVYGVEGLKVAGTLSTVNGLLVSISD
jgi:hypothetical protein